MHARTTALPEFDADRAHTVFPLALQQGREWGERLQEQAAA